MPKNVRYLKSLLPFIRLETIIVKLICNYFESNEAINKNEESLNELNYCTCDVAIGLNFQFKFDFWQRIKNCNYFRKFEHEAGGKVVYNSRIQENSVLLQLTPRLQFSSRISATRRRRINIRKRRF